MEGKYTTHETKYGKISLYDNEQYIKCNNDIYWDEDNLLKLKEYINPDKNILEIGGHVGTSTILYSSFLNKGSYINVYEPQSAMYKLLVKNIEDNRITNINAWNKGLFCYNGSGTLSKNTLDGCIGNVKERLHNQQPCNFAGLGLGKDGETVSLTTIDDLKLENLGFIHSDAQGSENFIFSKAKETLKKYRPLILYENKEIYGSYLYDDICKSYPNDIINESCNFNIKEYCMEELNYSKCIEKFNGGMDNLLIP